MLHEAERTGASSGVVGGRGWGERVVEGGRAGGDTVSGNICGRNGDKRGNREVKAVET